MASSFSTRRPPIAAEEVFRVADELVATGRQVTALVILDALGGGSLRTIYKHLTEWERQRKEAPAVAASSDVPEAIQSRFAAALADTWRLVAAEAAREVTAAKDKAAAEVAESQAKFDGALEGMQRYEEQLDQANSLIEDLRLQLASLDQQNKELSHDNAGLKAKSEQMEKQLSDQQTQFEQLHQAHERDRQAHKEQLDKLVQDHLVAQNKSASQLDGLRKEKEDIQQKAEMSERERQAAQLKLEQAQKQIEVAEKSRDLAIVERENATQAAAELKGKLEAQGSQIERLLAETKRKQS